jgi:hypothetical protein
MALQFSEALRDDRLDAIATALGSDFTTKIFTGAAPANTAAADSGTLLATFSTCNFAAASGGAMSLTGTPETATAAAGTSATPGHFRMYNGSTCVVQGTAGIGSGDMLFDGSITSGQTVNITGFTITGGGA